MSNDLVLKIAAFIAFIALIAGSTYGAYQVIQPEPITPRGVKVEAVENEHDAAPGHAVAFGLAVHNFGSHDEVVRVSVSEAGGLEAGDPVTIPLAAREEAATFFTLDVPEGTPAGPVPVTFLVETEDEPVRSTEVTTTVNVLAEREGLTANDTAEVRFSVRLPNGTLFHTNNPAYENVPFPKAADYEFRSGNITVAEGRILPGLWDQMLGMQEGETRAVTLAPEDAFGPARVEETQPRQETIERNITFPLRTHTETLEKFATVLEDAGQGSPEDYGVNDTFEIKQGGNAYTFRIMNKTDTDVSYRLSPDIGDRFTSPEMPFWPNGSAVTAVNETTVSLYVTPTTEVGEAFTYRNHWPDASAIVEQNETHIIVEHSPEEGLEYARETGGGPQSQPQRVRVDAVEEDVIRTSYASPNPLAGKTVIFDIHVLSTGVVPSTDAS